MVLPAKLIHSPEVEARVDNSSKWPLMKRLLKPQRSAWCVTAPRFAFPNGGSHSSGLIKHWALGVES